MSAQTRLIARIKESALAVADSLGRMPVMMEVCGTHTVSLSRTGLRDLLSDYIDLRSGPGCPVCVTDYPDVDHMIAFAEQEGVTVATFGDMVRVPGSRCSLEVARARGASVKVVYSPLQAVEYAEANPGMQVVFLGIGFETTAPTVAMSLFEAQKRKLSNFSVYSVHKLVPPVLKGLLGSEDISVDGFLLPGHVSTVLGRAELDFVASEYGIPGVIAGFEVDDLVVAIDQLAMLIKKRINRVVNAYQRVVREEGNPRAKAAVERCFTPADASWRGLGVIPKSGLALREEFAALDAARRFTLNVPRSRPPRGCRCAHVLRGHIRPTSCPLFAKQCTPSSPVGPCMVSSEGACAAYYNYDYAGHV